MRLLLSIIALAMLFSCNENDAISKTDFLIANGQMPDLAADQEGNIHLVYGMNDSLMYIYSSDKGHSFSSPFLIARIPKLFSFATRGPQIAISDEGIIVTAATSDGNIYSFYKKNGKWEKGNRVNDVDTVAKEGLMALSADGRNAFAVWLDLRETKRNKIYGAISNDGGQTWSDNSMIYTSPDTSVCECCKPSVAMKGSNIYVMFRNRMSGYRDLYLIQSSNGGASFGQAKKLGTGSWKLNACPMDGGALSISQQSEVQTVWRRQNKIFAATPGMPEHEIGEGRGCAIETVDNKNMYAWANNGKIVFSEPGEQKRVLGEGSQPVLKLLDNEHIICVWENEKQIHASVLRL
jgi:hypothetical protein